MQNTGHLHDGNFGTAQLPLWPDIHAGHPYLHRQQTKRGSLTDEDGHSHEWQPVYLSLPPTRLDLTQGQRLGLEWGRSGTSRDSSLPGLCWSSVHLVKCKLDEPCWIWTKTWVQAEMPDYSLNWAKRFSAIQCLSMTTSPTRRWLSRSQEPFSPKSVLDLE